MAIVNVQKKENLGTHARVAMEAGAQQTTSQGRGRGAML